MMRQRRYLTFKAYALMVVTLTYFMLYGPMQMKWDNLPTFFVCHGMISDEQVAAFKEKLDDVSRNKKILLWTFLFDSPTWRKLPGQEAFMQCPEKRCDLTTDRCSQPISDAVLFHFPNLYGSYFDILPQTHPQWQVWALTVFESEVNYEIPKTGVVPNLNGQINWTVSNRFDSDIFVPYSYFLKIFDNPPRLQPVVPANTPQLSFTEKAQSLVKNYKVVSSSDTFTQPAKPSIDYAQQKTNFALWYVSNCHSKGTFKRIKLFKELKKYIPIDVYGNEKDCSDIGVKEDPCNLDRECSKKLMSSYKFYLSFENSECNYYLTEKFFTPLLAGTLPVAFGAPLEHYEALAPENSFLHVRNFSSVQDLANYMIHLDKNDDKYNRYFKWKESHVAPTSRFLDDIFCKLCADLWDKTKKPQVYEKFTDWWNKDKHCIPDDTIK